MCVHTVYISPHKSVSKREAGEVCTGGQPGMRAESLNPGGRAAIILYDTPHTDSPHMRFLGYAYLSFGQLLLQE